MVSTLLLIIRFLGFLRVDPEIERMGLDLFENGGRVSRSKPE